MSDEISVKTWWNQASATNQTSSTTSNQVNDDFVLDFWDDEDIVESTNTVSDGNDNSSSDWENIKNSEWDENSSWLDDNEDTLNGDDLFGDDTEDKGDVEEKEDRDNHEDNKSGWKNTKDSKWDETDTWLTDDDTFGGDDLFGDTTEGKEEKEKKEDIKEEEDTNNDKINDDTDITDNEGNTDNDENIDDTKDIDDAQESNSYDNFDMSFDSPLDDDSTDSDSSDLSDTNEEDNVETASDTESSIESDTQSDSDFQLDLDSSEVSWDTDTPSDLDVAEEKVLDEDTDSENILSEDSTSENSEDNNIVESEWNNKSLDFTENENHESDDSQSEENEPISIDFTDDENSTEDSNETNTLEIWDDDFLNEEDNTDSTINSADEIKDNTDTNDNVDENTNQESISSTDVEFVDDGSSSLNSESWQEYMPVEWLNDISNDEISDEPLINDSLDNNGDSDVVDEDNPQNLDFDPNKNTNQEELSFDQQPNIQDYLNNQTDEPIQSSENWETLESNQSVTASDLDNSSSEENNSTKVELDFVWNGAESMNFDLNVPQTSDQDSSVSQGNTESWNEFSLNYTENDVNSSADTQVSINNDSTQEIQLTTTLPSEWEGSKPEIDNNSITQESSNEISFTLWGEAPNNVPEVGQMQPTLSLDQILDSELSSNPQYSNNSIASPENITASSKSKVGILFAWVGLFVVVGLVVVLAFPSLLPNRNSWDNIDEWDIDTWHFVADTGLNIPDPDITEPDFPDPDVNDPNQFSDNNTTWYEGQVSIWWTTTQSIVEFPDPYGWMTQEERETGLTDDPDPVPYIWGTEDIIVEEDPEEYEKLLTNDILSSISSFKSQAEWYYSYGQEHSDRKIIKYASQIINACDNYESQVAAWEWISQEFFSEFEDRMLEIINKIDDYNNWWAESPQIIQNTTTNENDNNLSEKDELKEYLYSR